ncbi:SURF1 family protein [Luteimonas aestuarii]|uniref:SURF1-like protein n=1 Tax=Luteimonas aestuarii TaxID=453837 RepID=A0A4R5TYD2_9GAMM|nr:SURF1 family protein [Luteimonas aestuarii]TDK26244.1 SURF1 family protein [Luteimonas aestuarii]
MTAPHADRDTHLPPKRPVLRVVFAAALAIAFLGFTTLGVWQVQRLAWKRDLVARVDARIHAVPVPAPTRDAWAGIDADNSEYLHVRVVGRFLDVPTTRTQAVTALGGGWWLLSPLQLDGGEIVLVNRGFVPTGETAAGPPTGRVQVTGLLRLDEPGGGFLRSNAPGEDRWHSRDVQAIAEARGLPADRVAPYFIDAGRDSAAQGWPRGGMTVVSFRDHHLQYALTWFALALLTLVAGAWLFVSERRLRHHRRQLSTGTDHGDTPRRR